MWANSGSDINLRGWLEYSKPKPEIIILTTEIRKIKIKIISFKTTAVRWFFSLFMFKPPIMTKNIATINWKKKETN